MQSLKEMMKLLSPNVVVSIRGRHAVGKSEAVQQYANEIGLPLQMRRLSQMTEGDLLGMPKISEKGTTFLPCEWFLDACRQPMVLFLDERNRALDAVKQSIFEICDSRQFYGHKLHPETRVVIAENVGDSYQVQACDPAEVSRTVTVELEPSLQEWLDYAKGKCHEATVEFIRTEGEKVLEFKGSNGVFEPNKKYPDRRSWFKLDAELQRNDMFEHAEAPLFFITAAGFLGTEVGHKFANFCKSRDKQVSVKDILTSWSKAKARLSSNGKREISNEKYVELVHKFKDWFEKQENQFSDDQTDQFKAFLEDCPPEPRMTCFSSMQSNSKCMMKAHRKVGILMVHTANGESIADIEAKKKASLEVAKAAQAKASAKK
jgi:hypothetical protein